MTMLCNVLDVLEILQVDFLKGIFQGNSDPGNSLEIQIS